MSGAALVFGASGQIGSACAASLQREGFQVVRTSRGGQGETIAYDPFAVEAPNPPSLPGAPFTAVVWAQGANMRDSLYDFDAEAHLDIYKANVLFVAETLYRLLSANLLADGARLCVISSVWQNVARPGKFSYMVSKAAIQGLVMSAAIDLASRNILVNAILPGALDTPMTRANLNSAQIARVAGATPFDRLADLGTVAELSAFLCSDRNRSITGEFVAVDLGFQNARLV